MDICGEHGEDIAYTRIGYGHCPACDQIEQLEKDHKMTIDDLEQQISDGDERIGELESELEAKR